MKKENEPTAIQLIAAERQRQVAEEGWTIQGDDQHKSDQLAKAAVCYAMPDDIRRAIIWNISIRYRIWPWADRFWKPSPDDRIRELVKAGALIVAEIERLQRAAK